MSEKASEPARLVPPWREMRGLFEDVDKRMFLDVLGRLGDVEPGTTLADVEKDEEAGEDTILSDMSSHTYDVLRLALYSLGVLRPTGDKRYSRDLMASYLDVDAVAARAILAVALACDQGEIELSVAPPELLVAFKTITSDVADRVAAGEMSFLAESGEFHNVWYGDVTTRKHMAELTDAELSKVATHVLACTFDYRYHYPIVLAEVARRWLGAKGLK